MSAPVPARASAHVHPTAEVSERAYLGDGVRVWNQAQIREDVRIGAGCVIGKDAYVDAGVTVGEHCKIQNGAYLYRGVVVEDGVFVGPRATTTNDRHPRAVFPDGRPRGPSDFTVTPTRLCSGASIGAGAVLVCGITVGRFAMVGAGAVVTRDVPAYGLVLGNPARLCGGVCPCGARLRSRDLRDDGRARCPACGHTLPVSAPVAAAIRGR